MLYHWLIFSVSIIFVIGAGIAIGRISGELGERLRLGRAWAGAVLLSFATTLPELVTTVTLAFKGAYGLALGGILGSIIFNLFILVVVDAINPDPLYSRKLSRDHLATGLLGTGLLGITIAGLALGMAQAGGYVSLSPHFLLLAPAGIIVLYAAGQLAVFRAAKQSFERSTAPPGAFARYSTAAVVAAYAVTAGVIVVSAHALANSVHILSGHYGLAATFAGATMLGIVTSLPEITNAVACARQREYDLAVGNVLGANAFVLVVLAAASLAAGNGMFSGVAAVDGISALVMAGLAVIMQTATLGALAGASARKFSRLSAVSLLLAALYAAALFISWQFGS